MEAAVGAVAAHPLVHHRQDRPPLGLLPEDLQGLEAVGAVVRAVHETLGPRGEPTPSTERSTQY